MATPILLQVPAVSGTTFSLTPTITITFTPSASLHTPTAVITPTITITFTPSASLSTTSATTTIGTVTYITNTVIGWLTPDSAGWANAFILIFLPLAGLVTLVTVARFFKLTGDTGVYMALAGMTLGCLFADLSLTNSPTNVVPFAFIMVAALLTFLYWWNT